MISYEISIWNQMYLLLPKVLPGSLVSLKIVINPSSVKL